MKKIMIAVISLLLVLMMVSCEEEIKSYTVNFDLNGGGSIPSVTVLRGKSIQSPEDPSMEGMKFCGWYLNDNLYDFNLPITTNITLVAKWEHVEHIFNENDICSICYGEKCGDKIAFIFEEDTGTLRISGQGSIYDYLDFENGKVSTPWNDLLVESKIKNLVIEEGITRIGHGAFIREDMEKNSITYIELPSTLEEIGYMAFYYSSISEIIVPESVTTMWGCVFSLCEELKTVTLPGTFEVIGSERIFEDSCNIEKVYFGGTKEEWIEFAQWTDSDSDIICSDGNVEFYLSKDKVQMGRLTPYGRTLSEIIIPEGINAIYINAFEDSSITTIKMPSSLTEIRNEAFKNCKNLVSVELNENLTTIGYNAFEGCSSLKKITLPSTLKSLPTHMFKNCSEELKVTYNGTTKDLKNKLPYCDDSGESKKIAILCSDGSVDYCTGNKKQS